MSQYYNYRTGLLILLMSLIAYLILVLGFYYNDALMGKTPQAVRYIVMGFIEILLLLPLFIYVIGNGKSIKHAFRIKPISLIALRDIILVGIGMFFLVELINHITSGFLGEDVFVNRDMDVSYTLNYLLVIPLVGFIIPVVEESLFRGYLLRVMLRRKFSPVLAICLQALVFALAHLSFRNVPQIFVAGLILGFVAYSFYSIIPGIIIHSIFNLIVLVDINMPWIRDKIVYEKSFVPWLIMAGGLLLLIIGLTNIRRNVHVHRKRKDTGEGVADEK